VTAAFRGALEAIDRVLNLGGEADDILRDVVSILHERAGYAWVGIRFVEGDDLALGPSAGEPVDDALQVPVGYEGRQIAALDVAPAYGVADEGAFLERVATLISVQCLVGWDTGGEGWEP
jgi:hypothetical protein